MTAPADSTSILIPDLLHLTEWTFDRKHISVNANLNPNSTVTLKHKNVFGKTKLRHFSGKCPDTIDTNEQIINSNLSFH